MGERVFISYGDADRDYVLRLVAYLAQAGIGSYNDADSAGQRVDAHARQIDDCGAFIVVMSPESLSSASVNNDVYLARSRGKTMHQVLLRGEPFVTLRNAVYFDATDGRMPDAAFVGQLRAALGLAPEPVASASEPAASPTAPISVPAPPTAPMATLPAAAQFVSVSAPLAPVAEAAIVPDPAYPPPAPSRLPSAGSAHGRLPSAERPSGPAGATAGRVPLPPPSVYPPAPAQPPVPPYPGQAYSPPGVPVPPPGYGGMPPQYQVPGQYPVPVPAAKKRLWLIVGIVAAVVLIGIAGFAVYTRLAPGTPRDAVNTWFEALKDRDINALRATTCTQYQDEVNDANLDDEEIRTVTWNITAIDDIDAESATATIEISFTENGDPQRETLHYSVVKENGDWKVCGPTDA